MHADYTVQKTLCIVQALFTALTTTYSEKILKIGPRLGLVACKVYWEYGLGLNFGWFIMPIEESTLALIIIILLNYSAHSSLYLGVTGFCFNI